MSYYSQIQTPSDAYYDMQFKLAFHKVTEHEINRAVNYYEGQRAQTIFSTYSNSNSSNSRSSSPNSSNQNGYWCSDGIF